MILLWGIPGDSPLDATYAALMRAGADFYLFDQRRAKSAHIELIVEPGGLLSGSIDDGSSRIDLHKVCAAYIRPFETGKACGIQDTQDPLYLQAAAADAAMLAWADLTRAAVVNPPAAMAANNSKPYQMRLIQSYGFMVPDTLVTTSASAVEQFLARHESIIYKSVSGVRSIVSRLDMASARGLTDLANCPTQFQEYIPGEDVRVHVAGDTILATMVRSEADDYRYAARKGSQVQMAAIELPVDIAGACRTMVRGMGLHLAGIDFRLTPKGEWCCFEVNPSPGYTYYEAATGQPLADAVAGLLIQLDGQIRVD